MDLGYSVRLTPGDSEGSQTRMPTLDYAVLCDHVRAEGGVAHIIAAGIDTISAAQVPVTHNMGIVVQLEFTRNECGRPHRIEAHLQGIDGDTIAQIQGAITPEWVEAPVGWDTRAQVTMNVGILFPRYGEYAMEILVNDTSLKRINLRVVETAQPLDAG